MKFKKISTSFQKKEPEIRGRSKLNYTQTSILKVPHEELRNNRIIAGNDNDATTAQYKMLRTQILHRMKANNWTSLAISSACPGEGKTLTAINLSISLARGMNRTVMLVDFDLRRPSVARYFNLAPPYCLIDYVNSDVPLSDILFNPGIDGLVVLPTTEPVADSSEMLASLKIQQLVEEIKTRYTDRIVIFDLPPMLAADDALAFSPHVDAFMLVVEENKTTKEDLKNALIMLKDVPLIGIMPNKCGEYSTSYYYGY